MTKLTLAHIRATIAKDARLDPNIDLDEIGKAIVHTQFGWTWDANDGNRACEGFLISEENCDNDQQDTLSYWRERVRAIERDA